MVNETYKITGITAGLSIAQVPSGQDADQFYSSRPVPVRLDIDDFYPPQTQLGKDQVWLFLTALQTFQNISPTTEKLSYFQIAGKTHPLPISHQRGC
jgi:hypothetical protein